MYNWFLVAASTGRKRVRDTATRKEGGSETSGDILQTLYHIGRLDPGLVLSNLTVVLRTRPEVCTPLVIPLLTVFIMARLGHSLLRHVLLWWLSSGGGRPLIKLTSFGQT